MDVFTLDRDEYNNGTPVHGIDSVLWVERYNREGEFKIEGKPTHELLSTLADGTLISHTNTDTIMMVESHSIDESKEGKTKAEFIGRTVDEILMENRVVTLSDHISDAFTFDVSFYPMEFNFPAWNSWDQASNLMYRFLTDPDNLPAEAIPNLVIRQDIGGSETSPTSRLLTKLSLVSKSVRELLDVSGAGLKIERPNESHPGEIHFVVHKGSDKSLDVRFDWNFGDLESARYLWSNKGYKNGAYVSTDAYTLRSFPYGVTGWDLRLMPVDAGDWKKDDPTPDETTFAEIVSILGARGKDAIDRQGLVHLIDTKVSTKSRWTYNLDYKLGDLVSVAGNYDTSAVMRVVEYAATLDETGSTGFPTLAPLLDE